MTAVVTLAATLPGISAAEAAAPVQILSGWAQGSAEDGLTISRGIPFAAPPAGRLRWRPPQPPLAWPGIRKTDQFAPVCMQDPPMKVLPEIRWTTMRLYVACATDFARLSSFNPLHHPAPYFRRVVQKWYRKWGSTALANGLPIKLDATRSSDEGPAGLSVPFRDSPRFSPSSSLQCRRRDGYQHAASACFHHSRVGR